MMKPTEKETSDTEDEEEHFTVVIKRRKLRSVAACFMFLSMGLSFAIHGPALVNLRELLHTDTVHIAWALSLTNIGYLLSTLLAGFIFKRFDSELQFSIACLMESISLIAAPWSYDVYGFMAACTFNGFAMGYLDTGGNAYILSLWNGHRAKEPLMQTTQLMWSVGSMLSSFLIKPFLVDEANSTCYSNETTVTPGQDVTIVSEQERELHDSPAETINTIQWIDTTNTTASDNTCIEDHDVSILRYAYMLMGGIVLVIALLYVVLYCILGRHIFRTEVFNTVSKSSKQKSTQSKCFRFGFLVLNCLFFFMFEVIGAVGPGYISLFVVSSLNWTVKQGALLTAGFWGTFTIGRLLAIPMSFVFSNKIMLYITVTLTCIGYSILIFIHVLGDVSVYIAFVLVGLGTSSIFPSMLLWASDFLSSSVTVSAVSLTGSCLGVIAGFPIIGSLMEDYSSMSYVYAMVASSILEFILLIIMHSLSVACVPKKREIEMEAINPFER